MSAAGKKNTPCLLGIDLGSTSLKAVVYDLSGNVLSSGSRPTERFHPDPAHPDWTVWDPAQIWGGTSAAVPGGACKAGQPGVGGGRRGDRARDGRSPG